MSKIKDSMFFEQVHISSESNRTYPVVNTVEQGLVVLVSQKEVENFCGLIDTPRHHKESIYPAEEIQPSNPEPGFYDKLYSAAKKEYSKSYNKQQEFRNVAKSLADTLYQKNEAYGSSFQKSGEIMAVLYPDGIDSKQYSDFIAISRILDKIFRIATAPKAFNENPYEDLCGLVFKQFIISRDSPTSM